MKTFQTFKLAAMLTMLVAGSAQARHNDCEGPLDSGRWYLMPKIGVAPGIFTNRGYESYIIPAASIQPPDCTITTPGAPCRSLMTADNAANVFEQSSCKSLKFGQIWSNGVLHVGFELGHNTATNGQCFLEFFYDRASGRTNCFDVKAFRKLAGCTSDNCNTDCSNFTGTPLNEQKRTDCVSNYVAYGAYIGHRHYFNRIWCDRFALFTGVKFGLQHRKAITTNSVTDEISVTRPGQTIVFPSQTLCNVSYCKSNAVSGSIQFGFDYCINDCLTALVGIEVQATAPFKSNQNVQLTLQDPVINGTLVPGAGILFEQPTNVIVASTGTFVQFPVWVGFRWEFDFCKSAC